MAFYNLSTTQKIEYGFITTGVVINILCITSLYNDVTKKKFNAIVTKKYFSNPLSKIDKSYYIEFDNGLIIQNKCKYWSKPPHCWEQLEEGKEYKITTQGIYNQKFGIYPKLYDVSLLNNNDK